MLKDKIKTLISIIEDSEINEIEVSSFWGAQKIRLQKNKNLDLTIPQIPSNDNIINSETYHKPIKPSENLTELNVDNELVPDAIEVSAKSSDIIAPLVGTFYQSAKPGDPPFVQVGDVIEKGQIICIIEAMKIFNEIESEVSGKIIKILVEDSSPVEYGQPLMLIESI